MFRVGQYVVYGFQGVCQVVAIGTSGIAGIPEDTLYYTLEPVYGKGKIMIPVNTSMFMRPIISAEDVNRIIAEMPNIEAQVVDNHNYKVLEEHYKKLLATHNCSDLVSIMKAVHIKQRVAKLNGKNLGHTDEKYKKIAEDLLNGEFALALDIDKDEVPRYIESKIGKIE